MFVSISRFAFSCLSEMLMSTGHGSFSSHSSAEDSQSLGGDETIQQNVDFPDVPGYNIVRLLGRGAMGTVYEAIQLTLIRPVAMKMLSHADKDEHLARFHSEAAAVAKIQHPNIVQVYEINEHQGKPFITFELVLGGSLDEKMKGKPHSPREAATIVETLARAVHAAHEAGIVHRDLKPSNIMLTKEGQPKITDFGLAKQLEGSTSSQTQAGEILGTPHYMSPEQAMGRISEVGPGSDVYALGVILYELLTGVLPNKGETVLETLDLVRNKEPESLRKYVPSLHRDLETICLKCLQKKPRHRYESALSLADDLKAFLEGLQVSARPITSLEKMRRWMGKNLVISGLAASLILLVPMLILAYSYLGVDARKIQQLETQQVIDFKTPRGLPPVPVPSDNPVTQAKVNLGHQLFFDRRLSLNDNISCATCHNPNDGWGDGLARSKGTNDVVLRRNSPSIVNASYYRFLFWDGRAESMEKQATQPVTHPDEMGMPDMKIVAAKLNKIPGYKSQFMNIFGRPATEEDIGKALAAFERTLMSGHTVHDCDGTCHSLSASAKRGFEVFKGKGMCNRCHSGPMFTDDQFHNIGVGYHESKDGKSVGPEDGGRMEITDDELDLGAFKTPGLRDISRTAPYMHDGSQTTLMDVVEHYNKGGVKNSNLDVRMKPLNLTQQEKEDLVAFMKEGLTSHDYPTAMTPNLP